MSQTNSRSWREDLIIGTILFLVYLALGAYMSLSRNWLPGDSLARLTNAWLVLHGTEVKLASIGFVWPPIPTLLIIPFTLVPYFIDTFLAVVVVSAIFMALSCIPIIYNPFFPIHS
jgi:hypothetical protein